MLAKALMQHKSDQNAGWNIFKQAGFGDEEENMHDEQGWSHVNGAAAAAAAGTPGSRKWSGVANGSTTPSTAGKQTPKEKYSLKDNKVAYILLYQQMR